MYFHHCMYNFNFQKKHGQGHLCYVYNRCCLLQLFLCDYIGVCTTILVVDGVHTRSYWYWMVLGQNLRFLVSSASILQHQPIGHPSQSLQPSPSLHTISPAISISNLLCFSPISLVTVLGQNLQPILTFIQKFYTQNCSTTNKTAP